MGFCFDYMGQSFGSFKQMAESYGLSETELNERIQLHGNIKLAYIKRNVKSTEYYDHNGNKYGTIEEMVKTYGIKANTFRQRIANGWTIEEALITPTTSVGRDRKCVDHDNNEFETFGEMCDFYNINRDTVKQRLKKGCSLKDALTKEARSKTTYIEKIDGYYIDHKGTRFLHLKDMAVSWNMPIYVLQGRLSAGWTVEKALDTPIKTQITTPIEDHKGNEYATVKELAIAYGITTHALLSRLKRGWSMQKALETPIKQ